MKTHTPGPWQQSGTHIRYQKNPGGYRFEIAEVFRDVGSEVGKANARLIAAAPEMFEALQEIANRGPVDGYGSASALRLRLVGTQSIARAILAKLEGNE